MRWQIVGTRIAADDKEGVDTSDARVLRIVNLRVANSPVCEVLHPRLRFTMEFADLPKFDGLGGAGFGAGGCEPSLLPVVTKSALESPPIIGIASHDSEGARRDTIGAAVADIGLHVDSPELGADDSPSGTGFKTTGVFTVLADIGREGPGRLLAR